MQFQTVYEVFNMLIFDLFCIDFDWSTIECFIVIKRLDLICTSLGKPSPLVRNKTLILNDMKSHNDQKS